MMFEIQKLNLVRFGKFKDFEVDLKSGFNVISGGNEAGKSTLNLFVKAMLYGLPTRKKSGEKLKERERIIPWDERFAEGVLTASLDGKTIEIRRRFGKTAAGDKFEICDAISGEKFEEFSSDTAGEKLLGMSQGIFEKTLWIGQGSAYMGGRDDELLKRIANLTNGGDESVSAKEATEKLEAYKRKLKAKDGRSLPGVIDVLDKRLEECRREKYDLSTRLAQTEACRVRGKNAEEELKVTESKLKATELKYKENIEYERVAADRELYLQICECDKRLEKIRSDERYRIAADLDEEVINSATIKTEKIESYEKMQNQDSKIDDASKEREDCERRKIGFGMMAGGGGMLACLGAIMTIVSAVASIESTGFIVTSVLTLLLGTVILSIGIKNIKSCNNSINRLMMTIKDEENNKIEADREASELKREVAEIFEKYNVKSLPELRELYVAEQGLLEREKSIEAIRKDLSDGIDTDKLKSEAESIDADEPDSSGNIEKELEALRRRQVELISEIKSIESKMAYEVGEFRIPADIDTEINSIKAERDKACMEYDAAELAVSMIKRAADEWNAAISPEISKSVDIVMTRITDGKYDKIRMSDEFALRIEGGSELEDAEYFSRGTYEQLYFAVRFALSKFACGGNPMFLDDILTVYDDKRANAVLNFLKEAENDFQIIMFTCHEHTTEAARKCGANIINI